MNNSASLTHLHKDNIFTWDFNLKIIERWPSNKVVNISDLTSNSHQSQSMGKAKPNLKEMSQKTKNKTEK